MSTCVLTGKGPSASSVLCKDAMKAQAWMSQLAPCGSMTPFHAAVLLTLSSIPRLQQSAWSILKVPSQVLHCCRVELLPLLRSPVC